MELYVGNLVYNMTESELRDLFAAYGSVGSVRIITDYLTRQSRGFGYIQMPDSSEGHKAIRELDGSPLHERHLVVKAARPRDERQGCGW